MICSEGPVGSRQVLVVQRDSGPHVGASFAPLQPVKKPTECTLESCGEGDRLKSGQMLACASPRAVFHGEVRPSGDGLPGSY
jgi:hypothetical protein